MLSLAQVCTGPIVDLPRPTKTHAVARRLEFAFALPSPLPPTFLLVPQERTEQELNHPPLPHLHFRRHRHPPEVSDSLGAEHTKQAIGFSPANRENFFIGFAVDEQIRREPESIIRFETADGRDVPLVVEEDFCRKVCRCAQTFIGCGDSGKG